MRIRTKHVTRLLAPLCLLPGILAAQEREWGYRAEIGGASSARPFWLHSNTRNKIAPDTYLWGNAGVSTGFAKRDTRAFDFSLGFEGTGALGKDDHRIFVNQLFGKVRWQNLTLNLGMWDRPGQYDGLSASNGDILYANNTRNMPGISLASWDYIKFPRKVGQWLAFKFKYAEFLTTDDRYISRARLHNKMLAGKLTVAPCFSLEVGVEDYGQWGGKEPKGKIKYSLKDYAKMVCIQSGGANASASDQINKLGNHVGRYFAAANYTGKAIAATLYYNHLFEDGSGMRLQNGRDGLYGLYLTRREGGKWFKSFVYEFYYTKHQSGPRHDRPATEEEKAEQDPSDPFYGKVVLGGNDSYFNHGEYRSGWSHYGQIIGVPFFTPTAVTDGIIHGTVNNRFIAHHWGVAGELPLLDIRYRLLCSYSLNYGTYGTPFKNADGDKAAKPQFSFGLQLTAPETKLPFAATLQLGFDKGQLLKDSFGAMLSISKAGIF